MAMTNSSVQHLYPVCRCQSRHGAHYHCPYPLCTYSMDARPERMQSHLNTHIPQCIDLMDYQFPSTQDHSSSDQQHSLPHDLIVNLSIEGHRSPVRIRLCSQRCNLMQNNHRHCPFCNNACKNTLAVVRSHILSQHALAEVPAIPFTESTLRLLSAVPLTSKLDLWAVCSYERGASWITHVSTADPQPTCDNQLCNQHDVEGNLIR